jgi:hypothetical protein
MKILAYTSPARERVRVAMTKRAGARRVAAAGGPPAAADAFEALAAGDVRGVAGPAGARRDGGRPWAPA